ncbi:hypothetical protein [Saccharothrix sp. ALI-22-I]|uniref:hypothetical protein n=1 Tax=Saccharothrix sp. ALI-22-I TaxID=1933778 RepID=UPI001930F705|nr:hypothetical protein [Saccharothrix sp. ALI-22-I]
MDTPVFAASDSSVHRWAGGELRLPAGDGKEAFIDAEDIAEVAVAALTEDGRRVLGRPLRNFSDYAKAAAAQGAWHV